MKDALKRAAQAIGLVPTEPTEAVAETTVDATALDAGIVLSTAAAEGLQALADPLADLQGKFDAQATDLATALAELGEAKTALNEVTAALEAIKAANAKAEADAVAAKLAKRKDAIAAALGTERADAFMAATAAMPDGQFQTVMAAMNVSFKAEEDKPEFKEVGIDAQADLDALAAEAAGNGTLAILQAKYQQNAAK